MSKERGGRDVPELSREQKRKAREELEAQEETAGTGEQPTQPSGPGDDEGEGGIPDTK